MMQRRNFLGLGSMAALGLVDRASAAPPPFQSEKSKLKINSVRLVHTRPKRPVPAYQPAPGSWSTGGVEVANPMSIYPEYKAQRSLFMPDPGKLEGFTVEISTDKGVKGYGSGGIAGGEVVMGHFTKLLMGEDPFNVERIWDILLRSSMYYGQAGVVPNAISGVDLALWDLVGNALGMPVYKLLGGETKARIPTYCTGNDIEQHIQFGYHRLKLAVPYGPADGRDGHAEEHRAGEAHPRAAGPRRRHHARLLDGLERAVHHRIRGDGGALPGLLDGGMPAAARFRRLRPVESRPSSPPASPPASTCISATGSGSCWSITRPPSGSRTFTGAAA